MSYRRDRVHYRKTTQELEREDSVLLFLLVLAGPFTFGITWLALLCVLVVNGVDAACRKFKK